MRSHNRALIALALASAFVGIVLGVGALSHTKAVKLTGVGEALSLYRGIPQHANVLGSRTAPVTLVEYVDLQCPYCREFETQAMPALVERYVRTGRVRVEIRPLAFIGPDSVRGRNAIIAAGEQNRLFDLAQLLYENQQTENTGWLDDRLVTKAAGSIPGLDVAKLLAARNSSAVARAASAFDAEATAAGVRSTPTVQVGKTGAALQTVALSSPTDEQAVAAAIDAALRS